MAATGMETTVVVPKVAVVQVEVVKLEFLEAVAVVMAVGAVLRAFEVAVADP